MGDCNGEGAESNMSSDITNTTLTLREPSERREATKVIESGKKRTADTEEVISHF